MPVYTSVSVGPDPKRAIPLFASTNPDVALAAISEAFRIADEEGVDPTPPPVSIRTVPFDVPGATGAADAAWLKREGY